MGGRDCGTGSSPWVMKTGRTSGRLAPTCRSSIRWSVQPVWNDGEPRGKGLLGITLRYPYEVRKEDEYFEDIPDEKVPKDMLELASHIVETKSGHFNPEEFEDHYEDALKALLKKKQAGEKIEPPRERAPAKVINLMDALRRSVETERGGAKRQAPSAKARGTQSERPKKKKTR
jgi:DNA end-binding protein Ku